MTQRTTVDAALAPPAVSVLMAAYNAAPYIATAVESILSQSFDDFEFIIINDGSTDRTLDILTGYARRDQRIRLHSRANTGLTTALNEAIGLARGEFLARMDGDDISMPDRFERQVQYLRQNDECSIVGSRITIIDPDGNALAEPDHNLAHDDIDAELMIGSGWAIVHPVAMMRRSHIERVGGYRECFDTAQDLDLFLRVAEQGRLANLPDRLLQYRQHLASVNCAKRERQRHNTREILKQAYTRRGVPFPPGLPAEASHTSPARLSRTWAWSALARGDVRTARKYAREAMRRKPISPASWHVLARALCGC